MDLHDIERAALLFYQMCAKHPEICPHNYSWQSTKTNEDHSQTKVYVCGLCGSEYVETVPPGHY